MSDTNDPTPIATPEQYRAALLAVRQRMTAVQLAMLQAHCKSPDRSISAGRLAEQFGLHSPAAANTAYGNYAHWIADELKYAPEKVNGKPCWMLALAYRRPGDEKTVAAQGE